MAQFNRIDPLKLLHRTDKWYVGGGACSLYAPAFPRFLSTPGYWDECYYADIRLERLYAFTLIDHHGKPTQLSCALTHWYPDQYVQLHTLKGYKGVFLREERVITQNNTFTVRLTLQNQSKTPCRFHILAWTMQSVNDLTAYDATNAPAPTATLTSCTDTVHNLDCISYFHEIRYGTAIEAPAEVNGWGQTSAPRTNARRQPAKCGVHVAMGADRLTDSWTINLCENSETAPLYELSVFPDKFIGGTLPQEHICDAGWKKHGQQHMAMHYTLEPEPGGEDSLTFGACVALTREDAEQGLREDMRGDAIVHARNSWQQYFASVPYLECSDPFIQTYYWYRWYGLRLQLVSMAANGGQAAADHKLPYACIFEGIGAFRSHISYSAPCHMRESSWMHDPGIAMGSLENFIHNQVLDPDSPQHGIFPGHIMLWRNERGFYHADWGAGALQVYNLTGDLNFVRRVYNGLAQYADYFRRVRDPEESDLYDILDQGETGQEYMSRYMAASPDADKWTSFRIKGVDATCCIYSLHNTLAQFASLLGLQTDASRWRRQADRIRRAVRERMWDEESGVFKDLLLPGLSQSQYSAAVGFYPMLTDIASQKHIPAMLAALQDPLRFGTRHPVPACPVSDPMYDPSAQWRGKRTSCPWNGRMWPMASSHVADGLANASHLDYEAAYAFTDIFMRYLKTLFFDQDPSRPNSFEHYNPETGTPSLYRGVDDYQHSYIVDLILRHVVGIQPAPGPNGGLLIDPIPLKIDSMWVEDVRVRGHRIDVRWGYGDGFVVSVDRVEVVRLPMLQQVEVELN